MAQGNPIKEGLYSRQQSIENELSEASRTVNNGENETNSIEASLGGLSSRLTDVRGKGYSALGHLDKTIDLVNKKWAEVGPGLKQNLSANLQPLRSQISSLQSQAQTLRSEIDSNNFGAAEALAGRLSGEAASVRQRANSDVAQASAPLRELSSQVSAVDRDLKIAETTVGLFSQAAFPLQQGEAQVLAVPGKLMEGEKAHGTLYFTNRRLLFEGQKEVVLEKHMFIATKKKMERVVIIDHPVGAVQDITKGRVGLLAGTGVFVQFKPEVGTAQTPIDVAGWEADVITRFYRYITGGEADRDIASVRGTPPPSATIKLVRCVACGAPHTGEIYQGQVSIKCEYCGSAVAIA